MPIKKKVYFRFYFCIACLLRKIITSRIYTVLNIDILVGSDLMIFPKDFVHLMCGSFVAPKLDFDDDEGEKGKQQQRNSNKSHRKCVFHFKNIFFDSRQMLIQIKRISVRRLRLLCTLCQEQREHY